MTTEPCHCLEPDQLGPDQRAALTMPVEFPDGDVTRLKVRKARDPGADWSPEPLAKPSGNCRKGEKLRHPTDNKTADPAVVQQRPEDHKH